MIVTENFFIMVKQLPMKINPKIDVKNSTWKDEVWNVLGPLKSCSKQCPKRPNRSSKSWYVQKQYGNHNDLEKQIPIRKMVEKHLQPRVNANDKLNSVNASNILTY